MRLALVFNPFKYKVHEENISIVQKYFGLFPPLSLAWVAAIAERAGHRVIIIDARTLGFTKEEVLDRLTSFKPDVMGFMMTTYMFPETLEWIKFLKQHFQVPVVIGGYNLRVYPRESCSHPEVDFGVIEQAYYTIPLLFKELESSHSNFDNVPGLVYKRGKEIILTPHPQRIDFNNFPNPARHLLPNELYAEFPTERRNFTVMVTSLGCPFECKFCEAGRTTYNPRKPDVVVREMEECYHRYAIREIDIFDYEFTGLRERVIEICRLLQEKKLDINWACRSRVDTVDGKLLEKMKNAGCSRIYFGLESGVQGMLDTVNKGIELKQIKKTIGICQDLGIKTLGFFLVGAPGETKKTIRETIKFAKSLNLDYVQFSKTLAKPLTPLWRELVEKSGKDYWRDWILGSEIDRELPRPWTKLTNAQVNIFTKLVYISYYCRPRYILRQLLRLHSWNEFVRKALAFLDMLFIQEYMAKEQRKFRIFNGNKKCLINAAVKRLETKIAEM